jgi:hypothetical protein
VLKLLKSDVAAFLLTTGSIVFYMNKIYYFIFLFVNSFILMTLKRTRIVPRLLNLEANLGSDGVSVAPDWRYDLVCDYLKASPSYRAVRKLINGRRVAALPKDFSVVHKVVLEFGDIHRMQEVDWWQKVGKDLYGIATPLPDARGLGVLTASEPAINAKWSGLDSLVLELPLAMTQASALKQIRKLIDAQPFAAQLPPQIAPKYELAKSKLRVETLSTGLLALRYYEKGMPLWQIGNRLGLIPAQTFDERGLAKEEHHKVSYEKEVLSVAARRLIRTALLVAENAARGRFPSDKPFAEAMMDGYKRKAGRPVGSTSPKRTKAGA